MASAPTHTTIEAVWRIESARLIGGLVRVVRDVGLAEDLAQEALVSALERWPETGIPDNPGAWLMATREEPRHRPPPARPDAGAQARRARSRRYHWSPERRSPISRLPSTRMWATTCCGSFSSPATPCSRRRRARRSRSDSSGGSRQTKSRGPSWFRSRRLPSGSSGRSERLPRRTCPSRFRAARSLARACHRCSRSSTSSSTKDTPPRVATTGCGWTSARTRCGLGRILAGLVPDDAEVHGLVALMELQASRARARVGPSGEPILLLDQDRSRWDHLLVHRGLAALARAEALCRPLGLYTLQAAIAACHARARTADETDWQRIVALYDALVELTHSPVVELNRAVAVAMAFGPAAGLELVDALVDDPAACSRITCFRRARRSPGEARTHRGGPPGLRARGAHGAKWPRAGAAPGARAGVRERRAVVRGSQRRETPACVRLRVPQPRPIEYPGHEASKGAAATSSRIEPGSAPRHLQAVEQGLVAAPKCRTW